jgi:hypothetical protein
MYPGLAAHWGEHIQHLGDIAYKRVAKETVATVVEQTNTMSHNKSTP